MNNPRILVAGIGNIFLGDDGFGVAVVQQLAQRALPEGVQVTDYGIRGFDLAYAILDGYDATIMVDATPRGGDAGTLYVIEPDFSHVEEAGEIETHGMTPEHVLQLVKMFGGVPQQLFVVGCEPETFGDEGEGQMGLSESVSAAVGEAVQIVESLILKLRQASVAESQSAHV